MANYKAVTASNKAAAKQVAVLHELLQSDAPVKATRKDAKELGQVYQKSVAFDIIKEHRTELADLNRKIQTLAKSTSKGQGSILSQLLGRKMQIEKTIEQIFAGVK